MLVTECNVRRSLFVCLFCCAAWAADTYTPLDVKPGLWDTNVTVDVSGIPPIPPELLAKLTPEQRAKFEERAKAAQGAKTTQRKHCLKKEDLSKPLPFSERKGCTQTIATSNRRKQEFRVTCGEGGMKMTGTVLIEAVDSENVKGAIQMNSTNGAHSMNSKSTILAKWIAPVCPADTK